MDESLKRFIAELPGFKPINQAELNAHFRDVARNVVPDIERKEKEQVRLNAEYTMKAGMKRVHERG